MAQQNPPMTSLSRWVARIPEPFSLSMILTAMAFLAAFSIGKQSGGDILKSWTTGLWSITSFSMQMVLCLTTGFALAQSEVFAKKLKGLCGVSRNYAESVALVATVSLSLGMIHWGIGLAGGTLLVREMNRINQERGFHGPLGLMGAAGYLPLMIWHGGLSGSAPLLMASDKHFMFDQVGTIGLSRTIGHWSNWGILLCLLLFLPLFCYWWAKRSQATTQAQAARLELETKAQQEEFDTPELNALWIGLFVGTFGLAATLLWILDVGFNKIGLNHINSFFLFLALIFHGRLGKFFAAFKSGVQSSWSVILLFPFYGGIMSLVKDSGVAAVLSQTLAELGTRETLPLFVFLSAGILNVFVPSGGGQWVVQGPIVIEAGQKLGLSPELMVMSVAYGDQLTNMLQPFWALPLLGMTHIPVRDLLRYTIPLMFFGGGFMALALLLRTLF